jgi:hypothetical protein
LTKSPLLSNINIRSLYKGLAGIVTNLVIKSIATGGHTEVYWDIALRDFGLMLAALALARLASVFAPRRWIR